MQPAAIQTIRKQLGLTQKQLAEKLGVTVQAVRHWEQGQRNISEPAARLLGTLTK